MKARAIGLVTRLIQVAWLVDRSEWKQRYYRFLDKNDVAEGRKLITEADVNRLTPGFIVFLAKTLEMNGIDSRPLLERAARCATHGLPFELRAHAPPHPLAHRQTG